MQTPRYELDPADARGIAWIQKLVKHRPSAAERLVRAVLDRLEKHGRVSDRPIEKKEETCLDRT